MRKLTPVPMDATVHAVYLMAVAINSLIQTLPSGTAYCIGIVLMVMVTGRLMQHKGSLARAALPRVAHLEWGWHRVERAMERGKFLLDDLFDHAYQWCLTHLEVEPIHLGGTGQSCFTLLWLWNCPLAKRIELPGPYDAFRSVKMKRAFLTSPVWAVLSGKL
jgi:hypothetical protein